MADQNQQQEQARHLALTGGSPQGLASSTTPPPRPSRSQPPRRELDAMPVVNLADLRHMRETVRTEVVMHNSTYGPVHSAAQTRVIEPVAATEDVRVQQLQQ